MTFNEYPMSSEEGLNESRIDDQTMSYASIVMLCQFILTTVEYDDALMKLSLKKRLGFNTSLIRIMNISGNYFISTADPNVRELFRFEAWIQGFMKENIT